MISIIITHYRTPEMLKLALQYFRNGLQALGMPYEIMVSDAGTQAPTRDLMQGYPDVVYLLDEKNIGYAKLVNKGIRRANLASEFIFIVNADIILSDPQAIATLRTHLENNPRVGMVGPKLLNFNGAGQPSCFRFYTPATILARRTMLGKTPWGKKILRSFYMDDVPKKDTEPTPVDWLMGSAYMIRREACKQVGLLDEGFFMYMEDVDWCRRFWEKGWQVVYVPQATMYHYHFQASKKKGGLLDLLLNPYTRIHMQSAFRYFRKYGFKTPRYGR